MKPEEKAEIILWDWLRTKTKAIYFNRVNIINAPTFQVKSIEKKAKCPDMIILDNWGNYYVLEIKPANESRKLQQGKNQLLKNYWAPYVSKETNYYINDKEIEISAFLFTTENAVKGYLFPDPETLLDNLDKNTKKEMVLKFKNIPRYEYNRTYDLTRSMFSQLRQFRETNSELILRHSGYGVLTANYETKEPYMFCIKFYNERWGQHYWKL